MTDREIDQTLERAARVTHHVDPGVLDRITASIHSSLQPVRPLPATWTLTAGLVFICAGVAFAGAARQGLFGFRALGLLDSLAILSTLAVLACIVARECVSHWAPGSRHYLSARALISLVSTSLLGVFAFLLHDYQTEHFLSAGVVCLTVGIAYALPVACLAAWLLRRGFWVERISGGAIAGTLGGLSGVTMLELHCANLEAAHVLVWHVAVVPVSAVAGALAGWASNVWNSRRC